MLICLDRCMHGVYCWWLFVFPRGKRLLHIGSGFTLQAIKAAFLLFIWFAVVTQFIIPNHRLYSECGITRILPLLSLWYRVPSLVQTASFANIMVWMLTILIEIMDSSTLLANELVLVTNRLSKHILSMLRFFSYCIYLFL